MIDKTHIEVVPFPDEELHPFKIKISEKIINLFSLHHTQEIELSCSRNSTLVEIVSINERDPVIHLSYSLLQELKLPNETFSLSLYKVSKNRLSLGPIIGLLTDISEKQNHVSFGSIENFCRELSMYADQVGAFFYVFSIDTFNEQVGFVLRDDKWKKTVVPFPDVVHNRIHSRKKEQSSLFKTFVSTLQENHTPFFNDHFLNKWEVHEILQENDHLLSYLPDTELLTHRDILYEMLEKYECVFIKPVHGSQGKNIFRISKTNENIYFLDYTTFSGEIETVYHSFTALFQSLHYRFKQQTFIVQQCIPLLQYKEMPLDFRILCQKQENEKWSTTSAVARVSSKDQFVSNIARGGEIKKLNDVLLDNFEAREVPNIKRLMKDLSIEVASIIDMSNEGVYAELGIDLALDKDGKPTIIEVNTKPSKNLEQDKPSTKIRPSAKAIIQHCVYLADSR
ncbi:YheC/YheD family protein [Fredinandcohnia sp. 179-A 10B2 NHS]|uniref:YheC/YheD family endospore coat-associated protein n=1 Tax=Fredinandcohnia sp. 179-A 10B2 NHS TaxID=3235176 RepID=UPI0039A29E98